MNNFRLLQPLICAVWILFFAASVSAQVMVSKLTPIDGDPNDEFGYRVALTDSWVFSAAPLDDDVESQSGAVYVHQKMGVDWISSQKLKAPVPGFGHQFGISVAASGDWMMTGVLFADHGGFQDTGAVHLYHRQGSSWIHSQELVASDVASGLTKYFGEATAMDGSVALVGMPKSSFTNIQAGSVYLFELQGNTWVEVTKLAPLNSQDWQFGCQFGGRIDVSGTTIVVGAPFMDDGGAVDLGAAFVFEKIGGAWIQTQKLLPNDAAAGDRFGYAVAVSGNTILVSASSHSHIPSLDGAVYVFTRSGSTWVQTQELGPSDPMTPLGFGDFLDVDGNLAVLGAGQDADLGSLSGSVYAFKSVDNTWSQFGKFLAPDGKNADGVGIGVRVVGSTVLSGAPLDDDGCGDQWNCNVGSAYVFELAPDTQQYFPCGTGGPCGNHDDHGGCSNSSGQGGVLAAGGSTSTTSDSLRLEARWLPANVLGILFMGSATNYVPFGDGRLSLGPGSTGVFRILPPKNSGLEGTLVWDGGLAAYSQSLAPAGHIDPGETWYFQAWYRDPTGPCGSGFNVSNGLQVDFTP
jgi:hypothetical protein